MATSIRELILQNVETTLQGLDGIAFPTEVRRVERSSSVVQNVREFPTIFMLEPVETVLHRPAGMMTFTLTLKLECWLLDDLTGVNTDVNDFLRDVANVLLADHTRAGHAIDTKLGANEAFVSQSNRQAGIFVDVLINYRTSVVDVTEPLPVGF